MPNNIGDVDVSVGADASEFDRDLRRELRGVASDFGDRFSKQLSKSLKQNVKVALEPITDHVKDVVDKLDDTFHISAKVEAFTEHARKQINDFIDDAEDKDIDIDVNPNTAWATLRLAWLTRARSVPIFPEINNAAYTKTVTTLAAISGIRVTWNWIKNIKDFLKDIDKAAPKIGLTAAALGILFAGLLKVGGGIVTVAGDLASIWPLILAAPGLLMQFGWSAAVLVPALKQMGDRLDDLKDGFKNLGDIIANNFWAQAEEPFRTLVNKLMPQLEEHLGEISTEFGKMGAALAQAFGEAAEGRGLSPLFAGLAKSISILTTGAGDLVNVFMHLGAIGERYMPRLAQWTVNVNKAFSEWLDRVSDSGELDDMLDNAIEMLKLAAGSVRQLVSIVMAVNTAAEEAGGGGLVTFHNTLKSVAEVMHDAKFQETLVTLLQGAAAGVEALKPAWMALGDMLSGLKDSLSDFMSIAGSGIGDFLKNVFDALNQPAVGGGLTDLVSGLAAGLENLAPALPTIAEALGSLGTGLGGFLEMLGQLIGPVLEALSLVLIPVLDTLTKDVLPTIVPALQPLLDKLVELAPVIGDTVATAVDWLVRGLVSLLPVIIPIINFVLQLAYVLAPLAPLIGLVVGAFLAAKVIAPIIEGITVVWKLLSLAFTVSPIGALITLIAALVAGLIYFFTQTDTGKEMWANFINWFQEVWEGISTFFSDLWNGIVSFFTTAVDNVVAFFQNNWGMLLSLIIGPLGLAIQWIVENWDAIIQWIQDAWTAFTEWIGNAIQAFSDAWTNMWDAVGSFFTGLWDGIVNWVRGVWDGYVKWVMNSVNGIVTWWNTVWNNISTIFSNIWTGIGNFFKGIANGVLNQIESFVNGAIDLINGITGGINNVSGALGIPAIPKIGRVRLPRLAQGGFIEAQAGGILANIGEGRYDEAVMPLSPAVFKQFADSIGKMLAQNSRLTDGFNPTQNTSLGNDYARQRRVQTLQPTIVLPEEMKLVVVDQSGEIQLAVQGPIDKSLSILSAGNLYSELGV